MTQNQANLIELLKEAEKVKMTPDQIRTQKISFIHGQTGIPKERIIQVLDRQ